MHFDKISTGYMPLKVVWMLKQNDIPMHDHDFDELVMVFEGEGIHVYEDEEYPIGAGDIFMIKPGMRHCYRQTESLELVNILYQADQLALNMYDIGSLPGYHAFFEFEPAMRRQHGFTGRMRLHGERLDYLKNLAILLRDELGNQNQGGLFMGVSYLMQIIAFIARKYSGMKNPAQMDLLRLGATLSYIREHCTQELSLADLARKASMSQATLYRAFIKTVGMAPVNYVIAQKVALAKTMLTDSAVEISTVAASCGFSDSNYFSRTFKKFSGMTPRDYRNKFRSQ